MKRGVLKNKEVTPRYRAGRKNHFSDPPLGNLKLSVGRSEIFSTIHPSILDLNRLFYKTSHAFHTITIGVESEGKGTRRVMNVVKHPDVNCYR